MVKIKYIHLGDDFSDVLFVCGSANLILINLDCDSRFDEEFTLKQVD